MWTMKNTPYLFTNTYSRIVTNKNARNPKYQQPHEKRARFKWPITINSWYYCNLSVLGTSFALSWSIYKFAFNLDFGYALEKAGIEGEMASGWTVMPPPLLHVRITPGWQKAVFFGRGASTATDRKIVKFCPVCLRLALKGLLSSH